MVKDKPSQTRYFYGHSVQWRPALVYDWEQHICSKSARNWKLLDGHRQSESPTDKYHILSYNTGPELVINQLGFYSARVCVCVHETERRFVGQWQIRVCIKCHKE